MKPPKKTYSFVLDQDMMEFFDQKAREEERSRSLYINRLLYPIYEKMKEEK